jgi:gliding motility-associated protein GldL
MGADVNQKRKWNAMFGSSGFRNATHVIAGLGASVVIVGALFKIEHRPGASEMLTIGLITEAIIFALYALMPLEESGHESSGGGGSADAVAKQLEQAGIDQALLEKLKNSMSNLADNASSLGAVSSAAGATDNYVKSLESASLGISKLADQYAASASAIAGIVADADGNFGVETQKLGQNIAALNNVYELQLKSSQDYLNSTSQMNQLQESIKNVMSDLASSAQDTQIYRENMSMLSKNLTELNTVYGNMLRALKG